MAILLGVLAALQYRWVGQLSEDERERTRAHLNRRADAFSDDFNRELTRAFFWLQVGPEIWRDRPPVSDVARYERWYTSAPRPELVSAIYRLTFDPSDFGNRIEVMQFARDPARLEPAELDPALAPVHARLIEAMREHQRDGTRPVRIPLVWPDIPAIVMPRVPLGERPGQPGNYGYTVALLNRQVIERDLIPMLVERHFGGQDDAVFAAVVAPSGPVYVPEGAPDALITSPDTRFELFEIRLGEFRRFVVERRGADGEGTGPAAAPGDRRPPPPVATINLFRDERARGGLRGGGPAWYVHLLHRAGSVDAAVASVRLRNLLVSFGVLMLLAGSMALVLVATGRARRLAAQQMEFVAGVSHELRTPLAVIRSAAENLADGIVSDPKQVRRYGEVITGEGRRLTQMVEQIMEFAGFESGRTSLEVRPAAVGAIVEEALRASAPHIREHGALVEQRMPPELPLVLVDAGAVSRSLQNLVVNALKYGGTPPRVTIVASASGEGPRGQVRLTVSDNGAGISSRDLPHIFEPFYRGSDATARQIHGSGLGLSLVKRIMDEIGGRVTVRTEPGKGSTFTLHLPIAPTPAREGTTAPAPMPGAPVASP